MPIDTPQNILIHNASDPGWLSDFDLFGKSAEIKPIKTEIILSSDRDWNLLQGSIYTGTFFHFSQGQEYQTLV